ncbi:hypothetical protein SESBI_50180 [Sesbania bispinosa]|nr:hypothetical protein SESBI_50180 [Sesbania bispinosa]
MSLILLLESIEGSVLPPEIEQLLVKYPNVVLEDILHGLPPMRYIQYAIDVTPKAVIPNRSVYRMSPQKHVENRRQV